MKFLKSTLGYFLAAVIVNRGWGIFINEFGILGGYLAALCLSGSMWYINHYLCLIKQDQDSAFIDMGLGIAICLVIKGYMLNGINSVITSMPTLICIAIGAILGGYAAVAIEKYSRKRSKEDNFDILNL